MPTVKGTSPAAFLAAMAKAGVRATVGPAAGGEAGVPSPARGMGTPHLTLTVTVPVRLVSEANAGGQLRAKMARKSAVKDAVRAALPGFAFPLPAVVTITRMGLREMDDDNNIRASKNVRDVVAQWLNVDDRDKRVKFRYKQEASWSPMVRITISHTPDM